MNAPVSTEQAQAEAVLRSTPKGVLAVAWLATLLGVLFLLRFCAAAYDGKLTFAKAILYGLLLLALLFMNGFSLVKKSRAGYLIVAIVAAVPIPGILAQSLHLVVILLERSWGTDSIGLTTCLLSAGQFGVTTLLYVYLISREVRTFVWNTAKIEAKASA